MAEFDDAKTDLAIAKVRAGTRRPAEKGAFASNKKAKKDTQTKDEKEKEDGEGMVKPVKEEESGDGQETKK